MVNSSFPYGRKRNTQRVVKKKIFFFNIYYSVNGVNNLLCWEIIPTFAAKAKTQAAIGLNNRQIIYHIGVY